jgi:hypothetical protein
VQKEGIHQSNQPLMEVNNKENKKKSEKEKGNHGV